MESLLNRNESAAVKGLLIFLIVLGHNIFFTDLQIAKDYDLMRWLYSFHIQAFFLLPFLYGAKEFSFKRCGDYAVRFFLPMLIFLLVLISINLVFYKIDHFSWKELTIGVLLGKATILQKYTNTQYLWFLPIFFYLMILKDLYYTCPKRWRFVFYIIAGLVSIFFYHNPLKLHYPGIILQLAFPINLLNYLFYGITILYLARIKLSSLYCILGFIVLSVSYILIFVFYEKKCSMAWYEHSVYNNFIMLVIPLLFMSSVISIKKWLSQFNVLQNFGNQSFGVYLISPLCGYSFYLLFHRYYGNNNSILLMLFIQIVICVLSYCISKIINDNYYFTRMFFPKGVHSLEELFHRDLLKDSK